MNRGRATTAAAMLIAFAASGWPAISSSAAATVPGVPGVYESSLRGVLCKAKTVCLLNLDAVPAGFVLEATNINCVVNTVGSTPERTLLVRLLDHGAGLTDAAQRAAFPVKNLAEGPNTTIFGINEEIRTFIRAGRVPAAVTSTNVATDISITCSLSGSLRS